MTAADVKRVLIGAEPIPSEFRPAIRTAMRWIEVERGETPSLGIDDPSFFYKSTLLEGDSLISILGPRGSGKTTLLAALCRSLVEKRRDIVLPIIRPELFDGTDSLIAIVLANISGQMVASQLDAKSGPGTPSEGMPPAADWLAKASRSAALSTEAAISALLNSRESMGQYAVDSAVLLRERGGLGLALHGLFGELRSTGGRNGRAIVVPVDDADLVPGRMLQILSDLRLLSSIPGVVPIICADRHDLHRALLSEVSQQFGRTLTDEDGHLIVEQQIAKTIRPDRILEPIQVGRRDRLNFTPLGQKEPLGDVLRRLSQTIQAQSIRPFALESWLNDADSTDELIEPMALDWLPETPRGLEHLWYVTAELEGALSSKAGGVLAGPQLRRFVDEATRKSPSVRIKLDVSDLRPGRGRRHLLANGRWPRVSLGVATIGGWRPVADTSTTRLLIRQIAHVVGSVELEQVPTDSDSPSSVQLDRDAVSATLLTQDLLGSDLFATPRPTSNTKIGASNFAWLQAATIAGRRTDDYFIMLPESSGFYVERVARAWNWICERSHSHRDDGTGTEGLISDAVFATAVYWLNGDRSVLSRSRRRQPLDEVLELATREYLARVPRFNDRFETFDVDSAFCEWYELYLPFAFHSCLLGESALETAIELWQAALSTSGRTRVAVSTLRDELARRIYGGKTGTPRGTRGSTNIWTFGYKELAQNLSSELARHIAGFESEFIERTGRGSFAKDAIEEGVEIENSSSKYVFRRNKTTEGRAEEQLIRSVLEQLRP